MTIYHRPETLETALDLLAEAPMTIAAGCTDIFPATTAKQLAGPVLDVTGIGEFAEIKVVNGGYRIGAAVTWTDLIRTDFPPAFDMLKQAARTVGSVQIQNAGTLVGNVCNASPAADGLPCLLALDASLEVAGPCGLRSVALGDFVKGPRSTTLAQGELVAAVVVPEHATQGSSVFLKLGARAYLVISVAMVAARLVLEDKRVTEAAFAVGSCGPVAARLTGLEQKVLGLTLQDAQHVFSDSAVAAALDPIDDHRSDADYRSTGAAELLRRAVETLSTTTGSGS